MNEDQIIKIRANLRSVAAWYVNRDRAAARNQLRFHRACGPNNNPTILKLSPEARESNHWMHVSEEPVWSPEQTRALKSFYNAKRKSGEMALAIAFEKPMFTLAPYATNRWRAELHERKE